MVWYVSYSPVKVLFFFLREGPNYLSMGKMSTFFAG